MVQLRFRIFDRDQKLFLSLEHHLPLLPSSEVRGPGTPSTYQSCCLKNSLGPFLLCCSPSLQHALLWRCWRLHSHSFVCRKLLLRSMFRDPRSTLYSYSVISLSLKLLLSSFTSEIIGKTGNIQKHTPLQQLNKLNISKSNLTGSAGTRDTRCSRCDFSFRSRDWWGKELFSLSRLCGTQGLSVQVPYPMQGAAFGTWIYDVIGGSIRCGKRRSISRSSPLTRRGKEEELNDHQHLENLGCRDETRIFAALAWCKEVKLVM